jgi:Tfp pilus assembly protein PilN
LHPLAWLLALGCVGGAGYAISALTGMRSATQELSRDLVRFEARKDAEEARRQRAPQVAIPEQQAKAVNAAIAKLNLPWRDLFDAIESATPPSIAVVSLEPDASKRAIRGTAEAATSDSMVAYIDGLKHQALFIDVVLTRHEINTQDPNKPLRFQFEAEWKVSP